MLSDPLDVEVEAMWSQILILVPASNSWLLFWVTIISFSSLASTFLFFGDEYLQTLIKTIG